MELSRNVLLDVVKVILATMVVFAHCNFAYDINELINYTLKNGIFRVVVPVFYIINGFYFVKCGSHEQFRKWLIRVLLLYVFWTLAYSFLWVKISQDSLFEILFFGWHHLWYVIALVFSGIMLFFLKKNNSKTLLALSVSFFLIGVAFEYMNRYAFFEYNISFSEFLKKPYSSRNFLFFGFPFLTIGYLIKRESIYFKKKVLVFSLIIGFVFLIIENQLNYHLLGSSVGFDMLLSQLLLCPVIFLCAKSFSINSKKIDGKKISLYSSAIYFVHPTPWMFTIIWLNISSPTLISLVVLVSSIILSYFLIKLNRRLKFIL